METPKALLVFSPGVTFIEKIVSEYVNRGCTAVIVVVNEKTASTVQQILSVHKNVSLVVNDHLEFERFYSLKLGLENLKEADFCFFQNVDNPFIDSKILDALFEERSDDAFVAPVFEGKGGHPVLLNRKNMDFIRNYHINDANLKLVLSGLACKKVGMQDNKVLANINSPEEYKKIFIKA
jgi:molybdenum cofactor cytidylyltransferase